MSMKTDPVNPAHYKGDLVMRIYGEDFFATRGMSSEDEITWLKKVATGRCARVSYLTHDGKRDAEKDVELHDRLSAGPVTGDPGHWSPFEHVAQALAEPIRSGNFIGWSQYRKSFEHEHFGGRMP